MSQRTGLINKAWTSRHGLHDKQVAHRNEANGNSENNVCASTPRFHDDFGTEPLPTGSRNISMPSDRLSVFLHSITLKRQLVTLGSRSNICGNQARAIPNQTSKTVAVTASASAAAPSFSNLLLLRSRIAKVVLALHCFTAATAQRSKRLNGCCHTTLHQRGQSCTRKEVHVRMRTNRVRRRVLFAAPAHVVSTFLQQCRVERVLRVVCWPNVTL